MVIYVYNGETITVSPFFIYEVDLYRIAKNRANIISTRYYKSNKLLNIKDVEVVRRFDKFTIERYITLLSAPQSFIEENNLSLYTPKRKRVKSRKLLH